MCLIKHMPWRLWGCMGGWRLIPWPLNFDTSSRWVLNLTLQPLYLQVKTLSGHWIGCRVGLRFILDVMHQVRRWKSTKLLLIINIITTKNGTRGCGFYRTFVGIVLSSRLRPPAAKSLPNPTSYCILTPFHIPVTSPCAPSKSSVAVFVRNPRNILSWDFVFVRACLTDDSHTNMARNIAAVKLKYMSIYAYFTTHTSP